MGRFLSAIILASSIIGLAGSFAPWIEAGPISRSFTQAFEEGFVAAVLFGISATLAVVSIATSRNMKAISMACALTGVLALAFVGPALASAVELHDQIASSARQLVTVGLGAYLLIGGGIGVAIAGMAAADLSPRSPTPRSPASSEL